MAQPLSMMSNRLVFYHTPIKTAGALSDHQGASQKSLSQRRLVYSANHMPMPTLIRLLPLEYDA